MGIPGNSGFQEPPKIGIADIINFQVGGSLLQTSFAKAFAEPDTEAVVIANLHQPLQPNETRTSHVKMLKHAEKKRASLNQQIRDIIQRSIRERKVSKDRPLDRPLEKAQKKEEKEMITINQNLAANKELDREERIRDEKIQRKRMFDQNMKTPSYQSSLDKELLNRSDIKNQKNLEKTHESVPSQETSKVFEEDRADSSIYETEFLEWEKESGEYGIKFIDDEKIENNKEDSDNRGEFSHSETSLSPTQSGDPAGINNSIIPPLPTFTTIAPSSSISAHCIMSLPPDFFELFEKLVGVMIVEQNSTGITNVTVTIHRPGSPLNQSEVLLQFFDTNPRSCLVELRGTPEAVHHFHKYHTEFASALQQSKLSLDIDVRRPSLLANKRIVKRRKG